MKNPEEEVEITLSFMPQRIGDLDEAKLLERGVEIWKTATWNRVWVGKFNEIQIATSCSHSHQKELSKTKTHSAASKSLPALVPSPSGQVIMRRGVE
mmetsp:Transcript_41576/g.66799  ORF Transcript_41576/g.66799 Transcript_41576/m.66799 type:complete len:97 (-) Transcript_41576:2249-2539(-)